MDGRFSLAVRVAGHMALAAGLFAGILILPNHHDVAQAAGTGPRIALGTVSGTTVPVNATSAAIDAYEGVNLDISLRTSAGITALSVKGDATGTTLPAPFSCPISINSGSPVQTSAVFGCHTQSAAPTGTKASGRLARFILSAQGNGCIVVALVRSPGSALEDTFTINDADDSHQSNVVDTATTRNVLVGTGSGKDCASAPTPLTTATPSATPTCSTIADANQHFTTCCAAASGAATATPTVTTAAPSAATSQTARATPRATTATPSATASGTTTATRRATPSCTTFGGGGIAGPNAGGDIQTFNGGRPLSSGALPPAGTGRSPGRPGDLAGILVGVGLTALLSGVSLRRRRKGDLMLG